MTNRWARLFLCASIPVLTPITYFLFAQNLQDETSVTRHPMTVLLSYFASWMALIGMCTFLIRKSESSQKRERANPIFGGFLALVLIPTILVGIWVFSSPRITIRIFLLLSLTSFLPLSFFLAWEFRLKKLCAGASWVHLFVLPVCSGLLTLVLFEVFGSFFLKPDLFQDDLAISSPDRSYWFYVRKMKDGVNIANSYGFMGPEPNPRVSRKRVLIIGDSIPAAGRPKNFPAIAQEEYNKEFSQEEALEVINASMSGFSVEQIYRYYSEKLRDLPHNYLIFSFYLDDVNRHLRFRKNNYLYSPAWPEWQQDVYYKCYLCSLALNLCGLSDETFLTYRTRYYEEAFAEAITILEKTRLLAESHGVRFAVFNIPRFTWNDVLPDTSKYQYVEMNQALETWCVAKGVPCRDILPLLIGKDITKLRISKTDIHFTDLGHKLVGVDLKDFLASLIGSNQTQK